MFRFRQCSYVIQEEINEENPPCSYYTGGDSVSDDFKCSLRYQHLGEQIPVGTLDVVASTHEVYSRLWKKFMVIVSTQAIKIFCMSAFILFIFQRLITKHLAKMADYTEKIDLDHLDQPLKLDRKNSNRTDKDELDVVVTAFIEMRENLIEDIARRKDVEEALKKSEEQ